MRRALALGPLIALLLAALAGCGAPERYPERPLFILCPWGAGGGTDRCSRQMAVLLEEELGVAVNVVNGTAAVVDMGSKPHPSLKL